MTMKIIVLAAAKGGVGKTTLAAALATAAALDMPETHVAMVDLDPQGSLTHWWNDRAEARPRLYELAGLALPAAIPRLRALGIGLLFVDCPPGLSLIQRDAIAVADLVLVPTQASPLDLAAIASSIEMAEAAGVFRCSLGAAWSVALDQALNSPAVWRSVRAVLDAAPLGKPGRPKLAPLLPITARGGA